MVFFSEKKKPNLNLVFFSSEKIQIYRRKKTKFKFGFFFSEKKPNFRFGFFFQKKKPNLEEKKKPKKKLSFFFGFFSHMDGPIVASQRASP